MGALVLEIQRLLLYVGLRDTLFLFGWGHVWFFGCTLSASSTSQSVLRGYLNLHLVSLGLSHHFFPSSWKTLSAWWSNHFGAKFNRVACVRGCMNPLCIHHHHLFLLFVDAVNSGRCSLHSEQVAMLHLNTAPSLVYVKICVPQLAKLPYLHCVRRLLHS